MTSDNVKYIVKGEVGEITQPFNPKLRNHEPCIEFKFQLRQNILKYIPSIVSFRKSSLKKSKSLQFNQIEEK